MEEKSNPMQQINNLILSIVKPNTVQLYETQTGAFDPVASSVLLRFGDRKFLVTCNHVFHNNFNPDFVCVNTQGGYINVAGEHKFSDGDDDPIDVRIIQLRQEVSSLLEIDYSFLDITQTDFLVDKLISEDIFTAVGFPYEKTSVSMEENRIHQIFYQLTGRGPEEEVYRKYSNDPRMKQLVNIEPNTMMNSDTGVIVPDLGNLQGMSGCGLWRIGKVTENGAPKIAVNLSGIVCAHTRDEKYLIATKIAVVTEMMRKLFGLSIPTGPVFKLP